jgi:tetratricopeptide (TPR) repeat protein
MADSLPHDDERGDRTARIEDLLLVGLDYYFAGEHERAINVWTRVLFLDRGHARAKAYIERARGALAERQRESEELIQRGMAAFDEGATATARELLSTAIARGGPHDVALALLERLNRLGAPAQAGETRRAATSGLVPREAIGARRTPASRSWILLVLFIVSLGLAALYVAIAFSDLGTLRSWPAPGQAATGRPAQEPLPLPRSADLALARATALKEAGHLKEALTALDRVGPGDASFGDAERLRAEIQGLLLAGLPPPGGSARRDAR